MSRAVAQNAASSTELDPALLRKMLPMLAMLAAGFMARQSNTRAASHSQPSSTGGGLGGLLGSLMGGGGTTGVSTGGTGGLASMLDMDGDGNPLDDILNMVGKARG